MNPLLLIAFTLGELPWQEVVGQIHLVTEPSLLAMVVRLALDRKIEIII
jgi:hypothetical protein